MIDENTIAHIERLRDRDILSVLTAMNLQIVISW
jgi:hypothetical protein